MMPCRLCPQCLATDLLETIYDSYPKSRVHKWTCEHCGYSWTREDKYQWTDDGKPLIERGIEHEPQ